MRWPWQQRKPERRNYTDSITAAFQAAAEGGTSTAPLATAALESAAGIYGRCMAAATVRNADPDIVDALSPEVLSQMARELIRKGESTWLIRTPAGRVALSPVAYATLTGGSPDPMSWFYQCHLYGPTDSMNVSRGAAGVLHVRLAFDSSRPWQGIPPWSWASSTGRAITNLEKLVADEARGAVRLLAERAGGAERGRRSDRRLAGRSRKGERIYAGNREPRKLGYRSAGGARRTGGAVRGDPVRSQPAEQYRRAENRDRPGRARSLLGCRRRCLSRIRMARRSARRFADSCIRACAPSRG